MAGLDEIARSLQKAGESLIKDLDTDLEEIAKGIVEDMKATVAVDTGDLKASIRQQTTKTPTMQESYIYADAKSPEGTPYAEFLEYGTGIHNEKGDGRKTPWKYKDRKGNWHTTSGMKAQPFIRPAIAKHEAELENVVMELDIGKYMK